MTITSLTALNPTTPLTHPTTLHALEFPLPQGGILVCLTPKETIPAYKNLYKKHGITCTNNTIVGYCGDNHAYRFPEYIARTDPAHADTAFAIELRLRKARKQAPNNRNAARRTLRTIAKTVPQTMLQVFWEEATRILLTAPKNNTTYRVAKTAFATSRRHATHADNTKNTAVLTEFAAYGIVDANIITEHINNVLIPAHNIPATINLLIAPATGGNPINPNAATLMRKLGHHTSLTPREADAQLIAALAHTTDGFYTLPPRFFATMGGEALSRAIAANPHAQQRLLKTRPRHMGINHYLRLVRDSGAWDQLPGIPGRPAYFFCREIYRAVIGFGRGA